ncbi:hypothetical protein [Oceanobacillus salinisoli]|uniref:hypothetical protein n=1 Tax=Oceanobacillus salinisoli TaxID=2678611 RepID=UPI0012E1BA06|nr:hypothetical protein [Oceanobacillus salinisoli]
MLRESGYLIRHVLPLVDPGVHWEIGTAWPKDSPVSLPTQKAGAITITPRVVFQVKGTCS